MDKTNEKPPNDWSTSQLVDLHETVVPSGRDVVELVDDTDTSTTYPVYGNDVITSNDDTTLYVDGGLEVSAKLVDAEPSSIWRIEPT